VKNIKIKKKQAMDPDPGLDWQMFQTLDPYPDPQIFQNLEPDLDLHEIDADPKPRFRS